ncbi:hypothetical protein C8R47DRAFT_1228578 [Mycena vitilis]|nr:hypothetical protein C8R47DRAFT_1228578 [Mycena vitilis]
MGQEREEDSSILVGDFQQHWKGPKGRLIKKRRRLQTRSPPEGTTLRHIASHDGGVAKQAKQAQPELVISFFPPSSSPCPWALGGTPTDKSETAYVFLIFLFFSAGYIPECRANTKPSGWTILDDVYIYKGVVFIVSNEPQNIPDLSEIYSKGVDIEVGEAAELARLPDDTDIRIISTSEARTLFGSGAQLLDGVTYFVNDPPQFVRHYYHWAAELWFAFWRTYSSLDPTVPASGNTTLPAPRRMWFNRVDAFRWRDYAAMNQWVVRASCPALTMEFLDDWAHRTAMGVSFVLERLVLADRSAAMPALNYQRYQRTAAPPFGLPGSAHWWKPIRNGVVRFAGVGAEEGEGTRGRPVITYISRQAWGRRMLVQADHDGLVRALRRIEREYGYEVHIVVPLETPSRIWRRIEAIEDRDMPSLPSLPAFGDSDGEDGSLGQISEKDAAPPTGASASALFARRLMHFCADEVDRASHSHSQTYLNRPAHPPHHPSHPQEHQQEQHHRSHPHSYQHQHGASSSQPIVTPWRAPASYPASYPASSSSLPSTSSSSLPPPRTAAHAWEYKSEDAWGYALSAEQRGQEEAHREQARERSRSREREEEGSRSRRRRRSRCWRGAARRSLRCWITFLRVRGFEVSGASSAAGIAAADLAANATGVKDALESSAVRTQALAIRQVPQRGLASAACTHAHALPLSHHLIPRILTYHGLPPRLPPHHYLDEALGLDNAAALRPSAPCNSPNYISN